jgi:hypothetical protein
MAANLEECEETVPRISQRTETIDGYAKYVKPA